MSDWFAGRTTAAAGNAALDLSCPARRPVGRRARRRRARRPRRARPRSTTRWRGCCGSPRGSARWRASEPAAPAPEPWRGRRTSQRSCARPPRPSFVLARNADRPAAAGRGRAAHGSPCSAPTRPWRARSAAAARPSSRRYTVSPLDGLRAALGDGVDVRPRRRRAHPHADPAAVARRAAAATAASRSRFLAADGTLLGSEQRLGGAFTWHGRASRASSPRQVAAVEVRARLPRDRVRASTCVGVLRARAASS